MSENRSQIIDAHHHLWRYNSAEFSWIDDRMKVLRRDFLPPDLVRELALAKVDGSVVVQARQTLEETEWLLSVAENSAPIKGVVGWAPISNQDFSVELDRLRSHRELKGLRHVIQDEPNEDFINGHDFNRGIDALTDTRLVYDILIFEKHLPAAIKFVDRHPNQIFVLDHLAKPRIRDGIFEPWKRNITELARRPNVYCKLSGMVTEANWEKWSEADLRPFVDVVVEAFTPERLMFGSDWPVCLIASTYRRWLGSVRGLLMDLSTSEKDRVFGLNAIEVYHL